VLLPLHNLLPQGLVCCSDLGGAAQLKLEHPHFVLESGIIRLGRLKGVFGSDELTAVQ
jgi:hypothetical protein